MNANIAKFEVLKDLYAKNNDHLTLRQRLELAYNHGYQAGRATVKNPLYDYSGRQIREVTQSELDWTL